MYAVHFLLFVMTLVLSHIIQSCLRPYVKHGETDQPPDEPQAEEATAKEDDEDCLWAPWSAWSECTVTCGDGISVRHRVTLILGNCTGDMVQEKICSEQHCPHGKDFIFQRKDDDTDQSLRNDEGTQAPEDVEQDHQYEQTHSDAKPENTDAHEVPVSPGGHVSGYNNAPNENVNPENDAHFDENNGQDDDAPRGRARGQSWTSDDGNAWGHQSSFDSISHGEEPGEEELRSGGEEKTEDADNCFSDCSPTDPPADRFGSERSRTEKGDGDKARSGQDEDQEGARSGKAGEEQGEKFGKGDGESFKDKEKSKNDESVKDDGKVSNDEENRPEVDTDFEDDDKFDDEAEDADDYDDDDDGNDNDESGSGKKQKREHEEEDAEQEDLEQEDGEEETKSKRRRKKKRRRKRKQKTRENGTKSNDPQTVCDPTEIGDTFLAKIDSADSIALAVSENEKCDSASKLTSETEDCSTDRSAKEVLEIDKCASAKKSTSDLSESEVCDVTNRL